MPGPLAGFRIIDVTQMISGPVATMMLGDQGADVIKVEPPGGDLTRALGGRTRMAPIFLSSNRSKRSVVIDLKQSAGVELLKRMVKDADVFVQNFRPGAAERMGIGEAALRAFQPRLIYVSISGFGESGPYVHKRVYDPVIQALSGLADIQSDARSGRPQMMRLIVPDKVTALTAAQAITAALLARERTGQGQHLRLAMLDAVIAFLWPEAMAAHTIARADNVVVRQARRDLVFETKDGYITAGAVSDLEWRGMAQALEHPEWLEDSRFATAASRVRYADERLELCAAAIAQLTSADALARLDAEQVPCAPILRRTDLLNDEQVAANQLIVELEHPTVGKIRQPRPAVRMDRTPAEIQRHAPALGEHTDEVLLQAGISARELAELRAAKVVS